MSPAAVGRPSESERNADGSVDPSQLKTVLFCSQCGHESPIDGDWSVDACTDDGGSTSVYECPECEAVITVRPVFDRD